MPKNGINIVIIGRQKQKAENFAAELEKEGVKAVGYSADVLDKNSLQNVYDQVIKTFGKIDILINGAGGNQAQATTGDENSFFDIPEDAMKKVFDLNMLGTLFSTQVFGRNFIENGSGCIVNISSVAAVSPLTKTVAYGAAKAAVSNFTQWMAVHFNQNYSKNIRVNAIIPGFFLSEQNRYLLLDPETGEATARGKTIIDGTPMARYGDPEELTGITLFLCSDEASFINGAAIPIDGGFTAFSGV